MASSRRNVILGGLLTGAQAAGQTRPSAVKRWVRFARGGAASYGLLDGGRITPVRGDLFGGGTPAGAALALPDVKLLAPVVPSKALAVGLNYKSHLGSRTPPAVPEIFYKPVTCLQNPGDPIVIPKDAANVHYEGELVIVMGKRASAVTREQAGEYIFGVTCGNDVSERDWQNGPNKDLQWWRAKGADTFGPLGPAVVQGVDYGNLLLETRLNGAVVQKQRTSDLLFDCSAIVSFISRYVTLLPGDVIYTGTPGTTRKMNPGDVVEVEIEQIGVLRNPVRAA